MFNAERLLGQLMGDAFSGQLGGRRHPRKSGLGGMLGGLSGGSKATLGVGLLGLAYAAYEHYNSQKSTAPVPAPFASATPPPPPPPVTPQRSEHALHLIRAMVCAAHADGLIDASEREGILGRAREAGLDETDIAGLDVEIRAPMTLAQLVVRTPVELRDEVYAAALIAITADSEAERAFLDLLASELKLGEDARRGIHGQLGLA